ncbi:2-oxo acid dehydrogenase subunit E2 [Paenibacillus eucommiae]|uniref:Pyruvate dehydrogenase E2 component (Dihydrolipoamide acetyltransferase) n=1 Tax=Paenibacillus eucommiae TaxID=1355755 RepID=A0ABS4J2C9_9BACL|nr:2-oxo acid dehydrogenase subunit E2 [Paenibacillus eucommiae]MBP1993999.1 pyruvate dehydrogenase E2 component (dihydrolipoamide acetyltransferase) [Paenibacillus eucommiae]
MSGANELTPHKEVPLKGIRKMIAARLGTVWQEAVHVTLHKAVDVTYLYEHKAELTYSLMDYFLYGLVQTLKTEQFVGFNGHFDGQILRQFTSVNLGIAVDHPKGLIVPVLHGAEGMELGEFAAKRKELAKRAKDWKQAPQELENGTFTMTNLGTMGIDWFTPILNPPQVAIMGLGRTKVEVTSWSWGDTPRQRALLPLSLTIDHRVLDGADAARFLEHVELCMLELAKSPR